MEWTYDERDEGGVDDDAEDVPEGVVAGVRLHNRLVIAYLPGDDDGLDMVSTLVFM